MQDSSKGKMFLAAERRHTETEWFRSYATFNFGSCQTKSKAAFSPEYVLNDETLAAGKSVRFELEENTCFVLLPVIGALTYKDKYDYMGTIDAGEIRILPLAKGDSVELLNTFDSELINYLQFRFSMTNHTAVESRGFPFDMDTNRNKLILLFKKGLITEETHLPASISIGKFGGRAEVVYTIVEKGNGVFVFVLQGAFEVQNRLLEARDGLTICEVNEVEIEALSNDAILLLVELPVQ